MMKLQLYACGLLLLFNGTNFAQSTQTELLDSTFLSGNIQTPIQLINGLVPGMLVSKTNSTDLNDYEIRIRGFNTVSGRANPLIVWNGMVVPSFDFIDPNDIRSIKVLRGAETAKYGMQGASGVIEVTSKSTTQKFQLNYHGFGTVDTKIYKQKVLDADAFLLAGGQNLGAKTDWIDETTQEALSHSHNVSFGQAFGPVDYRASINYRNVQGVQKSTGYERINGSLNLNWELSRFLELDYFGSVNDQSTNPGFVQLTRFAHFANPTMPIYFETGDYFQYLAFDSYNPSSIIGLSTKESDNLNILNRVQLSGNFGKLHANVYVGRSTSDRTLNESYQNEAGYRGLPFYNIYRETDYLKHTQIGGAISMKAESDNWVLEPKLSFDNQIYDAESSTTEPFGSIDEVFLRTQTDFNKVVLLGATISADLQVGKKLYLSVGDRLEGSSAVHASNRTQHFPWIDSRVNVSRLIGFGGSNFISFSHGKSGLTPYTEGLSSRYEEDGFVQRLANSSLQNEVVKNTEIGLDWESSGKNFGIEISWYWKTASKMLSEHYMVNELDNSLSGRMYSNFGKLNNRGIELSINYEGNITERVQWSSALVATTFSSEWKSLTGDNKLNLDSTYQGLVFYLASIPTTNFFQENESFGTLTALKANGYDAQGNWNIVDSNGDGLAGDYDDLQIVGQGVPRLTFGWMNNFKMNRLGLRLLITGAFGHSLFNETAIFQQPNLSWFSQMNFLESYSEIDPVADRYLVDYFVQKASYVRLSNIEFSYQLGLKPNGKIKQATLYLVANDLVTLSSYPGNSPDYSLASHPYGIDAGRMGDLNIDVTGMDRANRMFPYRSFTVGIRASLF